MSGVVDVLVLPPLLPTLVAGGPAFGALLGAAALGYAAYGALTRLQQDYQQALTTFHTRSAEEQQQRHACAEQQEAATMMAVMLAEQTSVSAAENATITFLREHARELAQHITEMSAPNQELLEQCQALLRDLETAPADFNTHFETYDRLFAAFTDEARHGADANAVRSATASALAILREQITSPLLDAADCQETRAELLAQLDTVEALAAKRQASVATQGLTLLRQRVYRELKEQAEHLQLRAKEREEVRLLVGDMLAKLQAIAQLTMLPELSVQAETLLTGLRAELAQPSADSLAVLRRIAGEVDIAFTACEKALQEQVLASYVGDNVTEVLYSLGYRVTQVDPNEQADNRTCVAAFDDSLGVEFTVDGEGHLTTEMVALEAGAADVDRGKQEKVCSMIDQVLEALRQRDWQLRERYRSNFKDEDHLRVVDMPTAEVHHDENASPKMMRIDES